MLLTILATIGLSFIIAFVYRQGRRDGIKKAIKYFATHKEGRRINAEVIEESFDELGRAKIQLETVINKVRRRLPNGKNN